MNWIRGNYQKQQKPDVVYFLLRAGTGFDAVQVD